MSTVEQAERLVRDVHPAEVTLGDRVIRDVRVFVTTRRLMAYQATPSGRIELIADMELAQPCSVPASRSSLGQGALEARLADGTTAWVNRGAGCGCHSPLVQLAAPVGWTG